MRPVSYPIQESTTSLHAAKHVYILPTKRSFVLHATEHSATIFIALSCSKNFDKDLKHSTFIQYIEQGTVSVGCLTNAPTSGLCTYTCTWYTYDD